MTYRNYDDVANQLRAAGLVLGSVKKPNGGMAVGELYVESSKSVRCDIEGERKKGSGAYWLHELRLDDGIWLTGAYWLDHGNTSFKLELRNTCAKCGADIPLKGSSCPACGGKKAKSREIPPEQLEAHKARMAESRRQADAEAKADAERAASWANAVWLKCRECDQPEDEGDYIARKKLKSAHGARILDSNDGIMLDGAEKSDYEYLARFHGVRVVPMLDKDGRRRALQFVLSRTKNKEFLAYRTAQGKPDKEYWPRGLLKSGLHYIIGGQMQGIGLVAEGFATAASLHEASNLPVAVAFDAANLAPVGDLLWQRSRKRLKILYAGDDDWLQHCIECKKPTPVSIPACQHCGKPHGKQNAGLDLARGAALATSGAWVIPKFSAQRSDARKGHTDFNDLRCLEGEQIVGAQIAGKLASLEWMAPPPLVQAGSPQQGGGGVQARRNAVSVMTLDDAVKRFVPLDDGSGDLLFDTWTGKPVKTKQMTSLLAAGVRAEFIKTHPLWIERGAYYMDQVGFDPAGKDTGVKLNTWRGWPMVPKKGCCDLLLDLLQYLCSLESNSQEIYDWLLCWMAYPLQNPGAKMSSAVIMHGPQGTGKSTIFQTLAKIYGDYATVLNQRGLEDKFNADWVDAKLFILAEEVVTRAEMWHIKNELKELITGEWVRVNGKFAGAYRQKNHINAAFLSNEGQPLPLENKDRRHCVVWTPPELSQEFYDSVFEEVDNGGVAAFYHHLMTLDLSGFHPKKRPPDTQAKRNLIDLSRPSEERFLIDWIAGDITFHEESGPLPFCACGSTDLYTAYLKWCRQQGEFRPRAGNVFLGTLTRQNGWNSQHRDRFVQADGVSRKKRQRMVEPSDTDIADHLKAGGEDHRQNPDESAAKWATRCFFAFKSALGGDQ